MFSFICYNLSHLQQVFFPLTSTSTTLTSPKDQEIGGKLFPAMRCIVFKKKILTQSLEETQNNPIVNTPSSYTQHPASHHYRTLLQRYKL